MSTTYQAEIHAFGQPQRQGRMSLADAALMIRDRQAAAVLLDVAEPAELDGWWNDASFPEVTQHQSFPGAGKSGLAIGPTQRLVKEQLVPGLIDYFSYAARCNAALRRTRFVQLCERELGAGPVRVGQWGELPLVSKREYQPIAGGLYSVPPHCDAIHFGREPERWPIQEGYDEGFDQISLFLSVRDAENGAGLVIWDYRAPTRPALDDLMSEFSRTRRIGALEGVPKVVIKGRPGQLNVLNTRAMHAVEQCTTVRQTLGSFIVWHDGQWRMFH
ncbi:hypothetical protein [Ramlibacter sp.]|uniref:hypothetical protein n=1 Tax=Ramlibacter sp. TaxID=1917967 RepID=UPI0017CD6183|nr:hypothetical protein [Ramlibacter sp.]MBA2675271.1 hypothetical protein [Ramlibacter sp.]